MKSSTSLNHGLIEAVKILSFWRGLIKSTKLSSHSTIYCSALSVTLLGLRRWCYGICWMLSTINLLHRKILLEPTFNEAISTISDQFSYPHQGVTPMHGHQSQISSYGLMNHDFWQTWKLKYLLIEVFLPKQHI